MYEDITYELILNRMLAQIPNTIDKREGSLIYNALAPAAIELQNMYIELDVILQESFADTQSREYLIRRCGERGITPEAATKAILQGVFNIDVPIGSRFSLDVLNYVVTEKISDGVFKLECETAGEIGNTKLGTLIPIEYIEGLTSAELMDVLILGEDEEETEHLRTRYHNSLNSQAFGGNISDYKEKVYAIPGVGAVKVYPTWNGGGTVKIVILDSNYDTPTDELTNEVQTILDPETNQGAGEGLAPIGHIVTVVGASEKTVDIDTTISYASGWDWDSIKSYVENIIDQYFTELKSEWADNDNLIVRISQIESRLLNLEGITDISATKLNGVESNLTVEGTEIPVRGVINAT